MSAPIKFFVIVEINNNLRHVNAASYDYFEAEKAYNAAIEKYRAEQKTGRFASVRVYLTGVANHVRIPPEKVK